MRGLVEPFKFDPTDARRFPGLRVGAGYCVNANCRRSATAAEAIRYAVEDLRTPNSFGAWLQVGDERFNSSEILRLYEASDYPLRSLSDRAPKLGRRRLSASRRFPSTRSHDENARMWSRQNETGITALFPTLMQIDDP